MEDEIVKAKYRNLKRNLSEIEYDLSEIITFQSTLQKSITENINVDDKAFNENELNYFFEEIKKISDDLAKEVVPIVRSKCN